MNEMDICVRDCRFKVMQTIQFSFCPFPVIFISPMINNFSQICLTYFPIPSLSVYVLWKSDACYTFLQVIQLMLWYGYGKRLDNHNGTVGRLKYFREPIDLGTSNKDWVMPLRACYPASDHMGVRVILANHTVRTWHRPTRLATCHGRLRRVLVLGLSLQWGLYRI